MFLWSRKYIAEKIGMKRNKLYVAVTGGIGSGKSTVMKILSGLGYPVFSADAVARNIYDEPAIFNKIRADFPDCVTGGKVDRKKLATLVFGNQEKLQHLNHLTHPFIMQKLFSQMEECSGAAAFAEVPLLFESGSEGEFDRVIIVSRDLSERIRAVMSRDGLTEQEVAARVKNQYDYERNSISGHTVLYNDGDLLSLESKVKRIVHEIFEAKKV